MTLSLYILCVVAIVGLVLYFFLVFRPDCEKKNRDHRRKLFNNWQHPPLPNKPDEGFNEWAQHAHNYKRSFN